MSRTAQLTIGAVTDFVMTAGATLTGYMMGQGGVVMPSAAMILLAVLIGAVAAAKQVRGMAMDLKPLVILLTLIGLTGCTTASPGGNASVSGLAALQQFTVTDLTAALTSAIKHEDEVAGRCWMTLLPIVQAGVPQADPIKGLASALQTKRNLMGQGGDDQVAALRKRVTLGCSALFIEENRELMKLGVSAFPGGGALGGLLR